MRTYLRLLLLGTGRANKENGLAEEKQLATRGLGGNMSCSERNTFDKYPPRWAKKPSDNDMDDETFWVRIAQRGS